MPTNKRDTWTSFSVSVFARLMVPTSISKSAFECHIFFFQAEDGMRDIGVTGVQTCALPISGVSAAWLTEGSTAADATPTVGNIVVTPQKAAAWVFGSYEVLEDTDFGQQLPRLLADAKDRLEEAAFATGAGSGGVPQGVVNGATTVVTTATTAVIALGDIYAVQAALPPRFRNAPRCSWAANVAIINKIRQLDTAGGASFWTNLGKGQPE